jgi:antitoxin (DNA-binding transcriptional repressor) of toxin-antitoxin stability system
MVTKRGIPIAVIHPVEAAPGRSWIGCMKGTARITGDVIGPALSEDEWTAGSLEDWDEAASLRKRDGGGHGG